MISSHLGRGGRRLALAGLLAALLPAAPAAAEATATLTVRARVVDDCHVRLPDLVPPQARRHLPDHVQDLIVHRCRRPVRPHISARQWFSPFLGSRHRPRPAISHRHRVGGGILVTITY